ncbi:MULTISPECIES: DUF2971 domain-containing protein [Pectobacterium]|uniref:DUF2971 domain-containing protein n=1 Tax=Pectobacterium TaxID=122277 RepID=UPI001315481F|nr:MULTISPECIES: DUF2971 domain-containing protein [Pectobacterium]UUE56009.1 DUF2971 domain-containing protein [Pectobacterium aroidearum]UUE68669.1 DUF2971 domain-containing protein [Pectobacterium aroidearum]UUE73035.1 DUF2971 domain-containing protein [Pectobacterium aroidearum]UUE77376.1 DUF2971 domain-containing protein [Pectobacterium aroidearum]
MNLYHYTDQSGFMGIFNSRVLWATKIQYLNDSNEYRLAAIIASKIINERIKSESDFDIQFTYQEFLRKIELIYNVNVCVCSLTEKGDLLSQWRGYSKKMGGYSIGFDFEKIKSIANARGFELVKCVYDESEQNEKIESIINNSIALVGEGVKNGIHRKSIDFFEGEFIKLAPTLKDKSFAEEAEWRLVSIVNTMSLSFRAGNSMLIPYSTLCLGSKNELKNMLNEVILGHTPNVNLAKIATQDFLVNALLGPGDFPISFCPFNILESSVPYRNW